MTVERWDDDRLDRLAQTVEANSQQIATSYQFIAVNMETITRVERAVERLANISEKLVRAIAVDRQRLSKLEENIASINANNERLDRIIDYLINRDRQEGKN